MSKLKNLRRAARPQDPPPPSPSRQKPAKTPSAAAAAGPSPTPAARPYALGEGLNVFVVSNDARLAPHAASSPFGVIEYNGHDAFEFGAVGQVLY
jgi:hypothetical protein